ncbi:MAG: 50S ribosomal protein L35, partial [Burkholderiaceae bacterium]
MPKMKTKKAAAKRFMARGSGSIKRGHATKRHILTKRTTKNKRQLRGTLTVHPSDL